jgi:hypothetical protein
MAVRTLAHALAGRPRGELRCWTPFVVCTSDNLETAPAWDPDARSVRQAMATVGLTV